MQLQKLGVSKEARIGESALFLLWQSSHLTQSVFCTIAQMSSIGGSQGHRESVLHIIYWVDQKSSFRERIFWLTQYFPTGWLNTDLGLSKAQGPRKWESFVFGEHFLFCPEDLLKKKKLCEFQHRVNVVFMFYGSYCFIIELPEASEEVALISLVFWGLWRS